MNSVLNSVYVFAGVGDWDEEKDKYRREVSFGTRGKDSRLFLQIHAAICGSSIAQFLVEVEEVDDPLENVTALAGLESTLTGIMDKPRIWKFTVKRISTQEIIAEEYFLSD